MNRVGCRTIHLIKCLQKDDSSVMTFLVEVTVTINTVSPSGFGHVVIFERSARVVVASAPPEILDPSDFGANTKSMGKLCVFICFYSHI